MEWIHVDPRHVEGQTPFVVRVTWREGGKSVVVAREEPSVQDILFRVRAECARDGQSGVRIVVASRLEESLRRLSKARRQRP